MKAGAAKDKDKGDADKHLFQAVLEKEKAVKIHFSFDSAADCTEWIALVTQLIEETVPALFGTSVPEAALKTNRHVPSFIQTIVSLLRPGMATEGIFRLPGSQSTINDLKARYVEGEEPSLADYDVPTLASLLKVYFRELAMPIVPFADATKFLDAAAIQDTTKQSATLKDCVAKLPESSRITLTYIMGFLKEVASLGAKNKMEAPNLAIATGPSLIRVPPGRDELTSSTQVQRVMERMIIDYSSIFNAEDEARASIQPLGPVNLASPADRPEMTAAERPIVAAVLTQHHENMDLCFFLRCLKVIPKSKTLEDTLLVVGNNRVYLFAHGKHEQDFPLIDLQEIASPSIAYVTLTFGNSLSKNTTEIKFRPCTAVSFDTVLAIFNIRRSWQALFVGAPAETSRLTLPESRLNQLLQALPIAVLADDCGGFIKAYQAYSDYFNVPPIEEFIWDMENLFANNYLRDFILSECVRKDKYPNDEMKCFMQCLAHNTWFTSIVADDQKLGPESTQQLVAVFRTNRTIRQLKLAGVGATPKEIITLADNLVANFAHVLNWINIANNSLDEKSVTSLCAAFDKFSSLVHLNVAGCGIPKKSMPTFLESLHKNTGICSSLEHLDISNNNLETVEASRQLGLMLGKIKSLRELNVANCSTNFLNVLAAFEKSGLLTLNISGTKLTPKTQDDVTDFLKRSPSLTHLLMVDVNVTPAKLNDILATHHVLESLDISDTDFGDEGVLALSEFLAARMDVAPKLCMLNMSRIFTKRSKDRPQAMIALAALLEARPITTLRIRGHTKSQLKTDLVPFIFGLINNDKLEYLDVAGNQSGDGLPLALAKILQHNQSLQTLYWDENGTTLTGLRSFKIGLARNTSLRKMPFPVFDMANILKTETDMQAVVSLAAEIQEIVFDNALKSSATQIIPLQASNSDSSIGSNSSKSINTPKKPIEPPRGRMQSARPATPSTAPPAGNAPGPVGPKVAIGAKRPMTPVAPANPAATLNSAATLAPNSAHPEHVSPRPSGRGSISKASVHRASLLFTGSMAPMLEELARAEGSTPSVRSSSISSAHSDAPPSIVQPNDDNPPPKSRPSSSKLAGK